MPTPTEYRHYADLCDKLAVEATDAIERKMLAQFAQNWRRLANYAARKKRKQEPKNSN
jgi:hypothetical protein